MLNVHTRKLKTYITNKICNATCLCEKTRRQRTFYH